MSRPTLRTIARSFATSFAPLTVAAAAIACSDHPTQPRGAPRTAAPAVAETSQPQSAAGPQRLYRPRPRTGFAVGDTTDAPGLPSIVGTLSTSPIVWHQGQVMNSPKVFAIYMSQSRIYKNGPQPGTSGSGSFDGSLIGHFLRNLGGSPYWNIETTYFDSQGPVPNQLHYSGFLAWNIATLPVIPDFILQANIVTALENHHIAFDPSMIYVVFTGPGVNPGAGFPSDYCAYHSRFTYPNTSQTLKYVVMPFLPDAGTGCSAPSGSPNDDAPADMAVNTLAHELDEAVTDANGDGWFDDSSKHEENADKCEWTFGQTFVTPNGARANMTLGGKNYLVQRNWQAAPPQQCTRHFP